MAQNIWTGINAPLPANPHITIKLNVPVSDADREEAARQCPVCGDTAGWCPGPQSDTGCHTWRNAPEPVEGPEWEDYWNEPEGWGP